MDKDEYILILECALELACWTICNFEWLAIGTGKRTKEQARESQEKWYNGYIENAKRQVQKMDKEKEIQEMARVVCLTSNRVDNFSCDNCEYTTKSCRTQCCFGRNAEELFNAGYRKADEVRKETAKEILQYVGLYFAGYAEFNELCDKYGVEIDE